MIESWPSEYAAHLAGLTPVELRAEIQDQRLALRCLERFPASHQEGHSTLVARLRLAERALQRVAP